MMNETSQLHPAALRAQCASAISNLEENNTNLDTLNRVIGAYINDTALVGRSYNAIRRQMEDYKLIINAKREANDSDIWDFRTLSTAVGIDEVLIGALILRNKEAAINADADYKVKINLYTALMIASMASLSGGLLATYYRNLRNDYRDLRDANQVTLQLWIDNENRYNEIEIATKWLFEKTSMLRSNIDGGLRVIAGASTGLPDSYGAEGLAAWRTRMQELREKLAFDQALAEIRTEHGDEAYEWVKEMYASEAAFLNTFGHNIGAHDLGLLMQIITDHRMIQDIFLVLEDERFSFETWSDATNLGARQAILEDFLNALIPIFGIDILNEINFTPELLNAVGAYYHSGDEDNGVLPRSVWIDPSLINPNSERNNRQRVESYNMLGIVIHELRHAYQFAAMDNLDNFNVSEPSREQWHHNTRRGQYIRTGDDRGEGTLPYQTPGQTGPYTREEYEGQPVERDAFGFADAVWSAR